MKDTLFDKVIHAGLFVLVVYTMYQIAMVMQSFGRLVIGSGIK
jgi:hypothetical protein